MQQQPACNDGRTILCHPNIFLYRSTALSRPEEAVEPIDRSNPFHMDHITDLIPPHEVCVHIHTY